MGYKCEELGEGTREGEVPTLSFAKFLKKTRVSANEGVRSIYNCKLVDLGGTLDVHLPRSIFFIVQVI